MISDNTITDRGQAYTLEGFIGAMIVLTAILFALQSVVIAPTTGGLADRTVESQVQQETRDTLIVAAGDNPADPDEALNLSQTIRYWNESGETYHNPSEESGEGYYDPTNSTAFYNETALGKLLNERFTERGLSYSVELVYQNESGQFDTENSTLLVDQGDSEAITASYMVTLFDDDPLLDEDGNPTGTTLEGSSTYPIPNVDDSSSIYNVVEVRIAVSW